MKVAIYCRLSDEDRNKQTKTDDSESIQNQKNMLIGYSVSQGWEIYDIYSDDDFRGADRNRPEFNRLLKDAEARKFDIVLCKSQARFTREFEFVEKYLHKKFILWNIRFIGFADNADTENKGNKKQRQINGLINEWYSEDLSNNIRSVFDTKRVDGDYIASFALYGYEKNPNKKGHLIIDKEVSEIVKEVFGLFLEGYGKTAIARKLNKKGIPSPSEYKKQKYLNYNHCGQNENSRLWRYETIQSMLCNEMYIGNMVQGKVRNLSYKDSTRIKIPKCEWIKKPNMHEAIIDIETWNKVQALLKQRFKPWGDTSKIGIFARKVKCINCGYYLRTKWAHKKRHLQCNTRFVSDEACVGCCISLEKLEKIVLTEIKSIVDDCEIKDDEIKSKIVFEKRLQKELKTLMKNITVYNKKIEESSSMVKSLYIDKVKGLINDNEFIEFSRVFHEDKEKYQYKIRDIQKQIEDLELKLNSSLNRDELLDKYRDITKLERIHLDTLIDYIEIGKRIPTTNDRKINIHWNF